MPVSVTCGGCQKNYRVKDDLAGRRAKCPACSATIEIPVQRASAAAARPAAVEQPQASGVAMKPAVPAPKPLAPAKVPKTAAPSAVAKPAAPATIAKSNVSAASKQAGLAVPTAPFRASSAMAAASDRRAQPAPLSREKVLAQIMTGFQGELPSRSVSPMYFLGVLFATAIMIALPLIYLCLIGLVCWGVYLHVINDIGMLTVPRVGQVAVLVFVAYAAPVVIGAILIVFMIKPLFARAPRNERRRSFRREAEPVLFALVDKVCAVVHAPPPKRIDINCDVNAAASLRRGLLSALVGNDLVLTLGMPLAAGLSMEQFAGVLAHEFGHFSQGVGMRLTYIVWSINFWFLRVVYHRDSWDEWLESSTNGLDMRVAWVLHLAKFCVWLTRGALWLLFMLGHLVAGFMLRQMEFDADTYETRLVGSRIFESTARRLTLLNAAYQGAHADAAAFYREGRLPDDLPRLMLANVEQMPDEIRGKLNATIDGSKTGLFDSHPCDRDRIAAARELAADGVFRCALPTSCLFSDFAATTRNVTFDLFCAAIGQNLKPDDLHPVDSLLARQGTYRQAGDARSRFFGGQFNALRPWRLRELSHKPPKDVGEARARLTAARQAMAAAHADYAAAFKQYVAADTAILQAGQLAPLLAAKVRIQRKHFKQVYSSEGDCRRALIAARAKQSQLDPQMERFEAAAGERLCLAMETLYESVSTDRRQKIQQRRQECAALLPLVIRVAANLRAMLGLRNEIALLGALCGHLGGNENNATLVRSIRDSLKALHERLVGVCKQFSDLSYPFDHAKGEISLPLYLLERLPPPDNLGANYEAADKLVNNLVSVYVRAVDRLCLIAEEAENAAGYVPLKLTTGDAERCQ